MNENDLKQLVIDTMRENERPAPKHRKNHKQFPKKKMEFSKKLMVFSALIYAATWGVTMFSWFTMNEYSADLKEMATWLFGATMAFYQAKSVMENRFKVSRPEGNGHNSVSNEYEDFQ